MIRVASDGGWWLTSHPDHARLAAAIAEHWGNDTFESPKPRRHVLKGIATHDDGWALRDAAPQITREGKPSAFSSELVGKYAAFEEIDLPDYLAVRDRAVRLVAESDSYAALLISMHTYNLLTARADRSTIAPAQLPLLDAFLLEQLDLQQTLLASIQQDATLKDEEKTFSHIEDHFRLLQAVDNLSLLSCVAYREPATLLHPLRLRTGSSAPVQVRALGERRFQLSPYPLDISPVVVEFPTRYVPGESFESAGHLQDRYASAEPELVAVTLNA